MNPILRIAYEGAGAIARLAAELAPQADSKILRSMRGRRGIRARYAAWAHSHRDRERPLIWMHAPSVGEGLQARPVIDILRRRRPDLQLAYTFFSPSAESFARSLSVDFSDYLPFDTTADANAALDALRPAAIVFSKLDVWPVLAQEASARGVRLGLISATLAPDSTRKGFAGTVLLRDAYALLDAVGAIGDGDAARLARLGVRASVVAVTGDTRYDQVWERAKFANRQESLLTPFRSHRATLVAGSTWPSDEAPLLEAWQSLRLAFPSARLIIAPHEPSEIHLQAIEQWASATGIHHGRLGTPGAGEKDMILVDRTGVLGDLYALAACAFVGGGFHRAGLHSVIEPAAFGVPVLFGPRYNGNRDATSLIARGGGLSASSAPEIITHLARWLADDGERRTAGALAAAMVQDGLGAAERSASLVEQLIG
ncbi:MAG: 3-deoxy-D-manno-octulosonic acid transferase [Gemmatimonadaceae bacterium]